MCYASTVEFKISKHAQQEMKKRRISDDIVKKILESPDQIVEEYGNKKERVKLKNIGGIMKVTYDQEVDIISILLSDAKIEESDEDKPGVILDYDKDGNIVGMEILDASKRISNPRSLEYSING